MAAHLLPLTLVDQVARGFLARAVVPLVESEEFKRPHLGVVIAIQEVGTAFEDAVIFEHSYNGNDQPFKHPYLEIAKGKCALCYREGVSSREIVDAAPHLLRRGDVMWAGGVNYRGICVGVSGLDDYDDEAIALQLAAEIWRIAMRCYREERELDVDFVGDDQLEESSDVCG